MAVEVDPFAVAPADEEAPEPVLDNEQDVEETKPVTKVEEKQDGKVVVTLKGGGGYDAPWIVIHAADVQDALGQLNGDLATLMDRVQKAGQHFSGGAPKKDVTKPPQGATQAPEGTAPAPGPDWEYRTGVSKAGKTWKAWMPPKGSDAKPVWL